jgi:pantothenate kinase
MLTPEAKSRFEALLERPGRTILGITGPPGAGKSTLAAELEQLAGSAMAVVPMDGFHLSNRQLELLGRADRKGAPDTFDAHGYANLMERLRQPVAGETIYAPEFEREIEESIAARIAVAPDVRLVLTEGNYLLLESPPWNRLRQLIHDIWYIEIDSATRLSRLIARHQRFGRSEDAARAWVQRSDEANARLIEKTASRADFRFRS